MTTHNTANLEAGTVIGSYRLLGMIGKGGMGVVYRAEQLSLQREVAVKILHPRRMKDQKAIEDFSREARIAASLNHHHLVPVYDVGYDDRLHLHFYAMKLVPGRTLSTVVQQQGPLSVAEALGIISQVSGAMGHAHQMGIIHRDLKPANIILTADGQAVVTDLGLAVDRLADHKQTSKRVLKLVGTAEYAAPEQLRNPDRITAAADVWALGAVLYFLITGEEPFSGDTLLDLVVAVATEDPPRLHGLPPSVAQVISSLMQRDLDLRPHDGHAAQAMIDMAREQRLPVAQVSNRRRSTAGARRRRRR
ncbi:MAG: serine/threonine protein kinase [Planctomycetota bacterium]|nr:MAG: serine/threonine protein kinase [Planctomycetota bacterium]